MVQLEACALHVLQQRSGSFTSTAGKGIDCSACVSLFMNCMCLSVHERLLNSLHKLCTSVLLLELHALQLQRRKHAATTIAMKQGPATSDAPPSAPAPMLWHAFSTVAIGDPWHESGACRLARTLRVAWLREAHLLSHGSTH